MMIAANSRRHGENLQARKLALHLSGPKNRLSAEHGLEMMHLHLQLQTLYADVLHFTEDDTTTYDEDGLTHCPAAARAAGFLFPQTPSVINQRALGREARESQGNKGFSSLSSAPGTLVPSRLLRLVPKRAAEEGPATFSRQVPPLSRQVLFHSMRERAYRIISAFPSWNRSDSEKMTPHLDLEA